MSMSSATVLSPPSPVHDGSLKIEFESKSASSAHKMIIFDWDDTLLPSSWLCSEGLRLDTVEIPLKAQLKLRELEGAVTSILEHGLRNGEVIIITNAETGWVELSAQKFFPGVVTILTRLQVVSARSMYEHQFPGSPCDWKVQAFSRAVRSRFLSAPGHVLSLGDSLHERNALHQVVSSISSVNSKSIKFVEHPTLEQLHRQIDLVSSTFDSICYHDGNLDLMLTIQLLGNTA